MPWVQAAARLSLRSQPAYTHSHACTRTHTRVHAGLACRSANPIFSFLQLRSLTSQGLASEAEKQNTDKGAAFQARGEEKAQPGEKERRTKPCPPSVPPQERHELSGQLALPDHRMLFWHWQAASRKTWPDLKLPQNWSLCCCI